MYRLAVCAIIKNEARYLAEWIEYHLLIGVEHFFIYNNNSDDDIFQIACNYSDCITVIDWPLQQDQQRRAYAHYVQHYSAMTYWTAFIDGDEFIAYKGEQGFVQLLATMDDVISIHMPWVIFGTNGHITQPPGLVVENYTMTHMVCPNPFWKTVCRAEYIDVENITNPHDFSYLADGRMLGATNDDLFLYHYMLRSEEDVLKKVSRGDVWSATESAKKLRNVQASAQAYLKKYNNTDRYDDYMLGFANELKDRLRKNIA